MKLIDWLILFGAVSLVVLTIVSLVRSHKNGRCSGCSDCSDRTECSKKKIKIKEYDT